MGIEIPRAVVFWTTPTPDEVEGLDLPAFAAAYPQPSPRSSIGWVVARLLSRPRAVMRARRLGLSFGQVVSVVRLFDTARVFAIEELVEVDGRRSPATVLLPRIRSCRPRRVRLGLHAIAQDEEERLPRALASAMPCCDDTLSWTVVRATPRLRSLEVVVHG